MTVPRSLTFRVSRLFFFIVCCSHAIAADSDSACFEYPSLLPHARQLLSEGHSEDALSCLKKAVERYPENRDVAFAYIRLLGQLQRFDEAFNLMNSYAESSSGYSRLKADLFWYQGATDSACRWYGKAVSQTDRQDSDLIAARLRACTPPETDSEKIRLARVSAATRYLRRSSQRTETNNDLSGIIRGSRWAAAFLFGHSSRSYADVRLDDVLLDISGSLNCTDRFILSLNAAYTPHRDFLAAANIAGGFEWYLPGIWYVCGEGACLKYDAWYYRITAVLGWEHTWTTGQIRVMSTVSPVQAGALVFRSRVLLGRFIIEPVLGIGVSPTVSTFTTQDLARGEYTVGSGVGYRPVSGLVFIVNGGVEQAGGNRGLFTGGTFEWEPQ